MCDPVSIAVAAVATTVVSTVATANAQKAAANAQANQVQYQAQNEAAVNEWNAQATENITDFNESIAEENAKMFESAAVDAIQRGSADAAFERDFAKRGIATARAVQGAGGTVVDTGTNLDIVALNKQIGEMNALTVMNNAEREAYGYEVEATRERNRAKGIRYQGDLEAENIRLNSKVGLLNAEAGADNLRYSGRLNARSTLIQGTAQTIGAGRSLFG